MRLEYFQLITRIIEARPQDGTLVASGVVPEDSTIFEGHFPGHPLMPGVLMIEAMAQTSGYLLMGRSGFARMPFLAGVREAKFRDFVRPGTTLELRAELEHDGSGYAMTRGEIRRDGRSICEAALKFRVMAFPTPELQARMTDHAVALGYPREEIVS